MVVKANLAFLFASFAGPSMVGPDLAHGAMPLDLSRRVGGYQLSAGDVAAGLATRAQVFAAFGNGAGWNPQP